MTRRLVSNFSGGRTSGYMRWLLLQKRHEYDEIVSIFANTGQEHPKTLEFVDRFDRVFGTRTVWVEAIVQPHGTAAAHRVVTFETACRNGDLFADCAKKNGVPNVSRPRCTRVLKLEPMTSYLRSIGWARGTYDVAVGIRADEIDRISANAARDRLVYPLVSAGVTKDDVRAWWSRQSFDLEIGEPFGNCTWCYKKSDRKLATVAREMPEAFDVPRMLESKFSTCGPPLLDPNQPRAIFRKNRTTDQIVALASGRIESWRDDFAPMLPFPDEDIGGACGESCEVFADNQDDDGADSEVAT